MLQFGLRLGLNPRQVVTTTPRPLPLLKNMLADAAVRVRRMKMQENAANLAPGFVKHVNGLYGGTRLGRQELDGEFIEESPDALWSRLMMENVFSSDVPELKRIVVAIDPPASATKKSDACGIVRPALVRTEWPGCSLTRVLHRPSRMNGRGGRLRCFTGWRLI